MRKKLSKTQIKKLENMLIENEEKGDTIGYSCLAIENTLEDLEWMYTYSDMYNLKMRPGEKDYNYNGIEILSMPINERNNVRIMMILLFMEVHS